MDDVGAGFDNASRDVSGRCNIARANVPIHGDAGDAKRQRF
jgi:hypothetical protein